MSPGALPGDLGQLGSLRLPVLSTPAWMDGPDAPRKLTSMIYAGFGGLFLYGTLRTLLGQPLRNVASRPVAGLDLETLNDIGYRAVAIGFPIFTLDGIVFAMLWAEKAWGSRPSAWVLVGGFMVVLFTLVGVNLLIAGMHSYVGA